MNSLFGKIVFFPLLFVVGFLFELFCEYMVCETFLCCFLFARMRVANLVNFFFSFSFDDLVSLDKLFANPVFNYFFIFGKTFFRVIFFVFLFVYFLMICFANTMVCETFLCCVFYSPRMRVAILAFYFIVFFSFEDLVSECHAAAKQF